MLRKAAASATRRLFASPPAYRSLASKASDTLSISLPEFPAHRCDGPQSRETTTNREELLRFYRLMRVIRQMENQADVLYKNRFIRGFCHLYDGQEAVAIGLEEAFTMDDHVITAYRCHAQQLLRGDSLKSIFSELLGKRTGCARGKGGSMHFYRAETNFYGGNGIVGAQVPVGAGIAFASKYKNDNTVTVAMYGDGAANQGQVYEAANMAALWKLPMIFLCENNEYGMGTSSERAAFCPDFYTRGNYVPGLQVDGMDVFAMREAMQYCAEWCRSGEGPIFLEAKTYRYHGHSMSDPGLTYRTRDEVSGVRKGNDCIEKVKGYLADLDAEADIKAIDKQVRQEVNEAVEFAKEQTELDMYEVFEDIYTTGPPPFIRATDITKSLNYSGSAFEAAVQ